MTIELIVVGKTDLKEVAALVEIYAKRINHYCRLSITTLPDVRNTKNMSTSQQCTAEAEAILALIKSSDYVTLLDERGAQPSSVGFSEWIQKRMNSGVKRLVVVIGGAYGFSKELYERANDMVSLSKMTFSHQIVRAIFTEQLYRAFTILRGEPYHHQ